MINGKNALKQIDHIHPDFVIIDLHLPRMNRKEIMQKIKGENVKVFGTFIATQ